MPLSTEYCIINYINNFNLSYIEYSVIKYMKPPPIIIHNHNGLSKLITLNAGITLFELDGITKANMHIAIKPLIPSV